MSRRIESKSPLRPSSKPKHKFRLEDKQGNRTCQRSFPNFEYVAVILW
jgi:hypothetical protein